MRLSGGSRLLAIGLAAVTALAVGTTGWGEEKWEGPVFSQIAPPLSSGGFGAGQGDFDVSIGTSSIETGDRFMNAQEWDSVMATQFSFRFAASESVAFSGYYANMSGENDETVRYMKATYERYWYWTGFSWDYFDVPSFEFVSADASDSISSGAYGLRMEFQPVRADAYSAGIILGMVFGSTDATIKDVDLMTGDTFRLDLEQAMAGYEIGGRVTVGSGGFSITPFAIYQSVGATVKGDVAFGNVETGGGFGGSMDEMTSEDSSVLYGVTCAIKPKNSPIGYSFGIRSQSDMSGKDEKLVDSFVIQGAIAISTGAVLALAGELADWDGEPVETGVGGVTGMTSKTFEIYGDDPVLHKMDPWKLYRKKAVAAAEPAAAPAEEPAAK